MRSRAPAAKLIPASAPERSGRTADDEALSDQQPDRRPLYGARMWCEVRYLLLNLPIGIAAFVFTVVTLSVGLGLAVTVVGLPLMAGGLAGVRRIGGWSRARARHDLDARVDDGEPLRPARPGTTAWVIASLSDGLSWRSALYCLLMLPWGVISFAVTLVFLIVGWPLLPWVVRSLAVVDRLLVELMLCPNALSTRVRELEEDRGRWSTPPPPTCGESSGTCTTAPRPGWWPSRWIWAWPRRSCWTPS